MKFECIYKYTCTYENKCPYKFKRTLEKYKHFVYIFCIYIDVRKRYAHKHTCIFQWRNRFISIHIYIFTYIYIYTYICLERDIYKNNIYIGSTCPRLIYRLNLSAARYVMCDLCSGQVCSCFDLLFPAEVEDSGNRIVADGNTSIVLIAHGCL